MYLIEKLKENKIIRKIWFLPRKFIWKINNIIIEKDAKKRKNGFVDDKFSQLYKLKKLYEGERCFIISTGPSLRLSDIELLKNEITFSMNSICRIFNETNWRPTFYGIQDRFVYPKMEELINKSFNGQSNVFISDELDRLYNIQSSFVKFPFNSVSL